MQSIFENLNHKYKGPLLNSNITNRYWIIFFNIIQYLNHAIYLYYIIFFISPNYFSSFSSLSLSSILYIIRPKKLCISISEPM